VVSDPHRNLPIVEYGRTLESAKGAMVLLHGRGASAADILGLAEELYHRDLAYLAPEAAGHT
jgi:phospholipase/carboxylesterase